MSVVRYVTFFNVGQGNSSLISLAGDEHILLDLHDVKDGFSVLDHLRSVLPKRGKKPYLSVFSVSHGDQDHISGTKTLLEDFFVGEIWYPNYDRFQMEGDGQSDDYEALHAEIERRRKANSTKEGDVAIDLTSMMEIAGFCGRTPEAFQARVLSPYRKDEENPDKDINDMSVVLNVLLSGYEFLYPGDSSATIWCERIRPYMLKTKEYADWAKARALLASHHGSHSFLDEDREACLENPKNIQALSNIDYEHLIISSATKFPTARDQSGDTPPHYAAYKWYKQYLVDKKAAAEADEHPSRFLYTCEGHVRFEWDGGSWTVERNWKPTDDTNRSDGVFTPRKAVSEPTPRKFGMR